MSLINTSTSAELKPDSVLSARVLIVDDEERNLRTLSHVLRRARYRDVRTTTNPSEVEEIFREFRPDLLLLDLKMPGLDGFEVMRLLRKRVREASHVPIFVLSADQTPGVRSRALAVGARDFISKPFEVTEALLRIRNLLETRVRHIEMRDYAAALEERVRQSKEDLADAEFEILERLALATRYRDEVTAHHAERVGLLSALIACELGRGEEEVWLLRHAAVLHDVGKIGVSDSILRKPGSLTDEEMGRMRLHTLIGEQILGNSRFPLLRLAEEIAASHHEWYDGRGYAKGLAGAEIPLSGRIVAVADTYDVLTHGRPYKQPFSAAEARRQIEKGRGTQFDPMVVDALLTLIDCGLADRPKEMLDQDSLPGRHNYRLADKG